MMKLEKRIGFAVSVAGVIFFVSALLFFQFYVVQSFNYVEKEYAYRSAQLVDQLLRDRSITLNEKILDWAMDDDLYDFALGKSPDFVRKNFQNSTFESMSVNGIVVLNPNHDIIYERYYDYLAESDYNFSSETLSQIYSYMDDILYHSNVSDGFVVIDDRLILFRSSPIWNSNKSLVSGGFLIFGKEIDSSVLENFESYVEHPVYLRVFERDVARSFDDFKFIGNDAYMRLKNGVLFSYLQLFNDAHEPIGFFEIVIDREISSSTKLSLVYFVLAVLITLVAVILFMFLFIRESVVEKVHSIDSSISEIIITDDLTRKINLVADEEINNLAKNFNVLIGSLDKNRKMLIHKNEELRDAYIDLKKLDQVKDNFLSNVSHEIRTPLTSLKSYAQLMLSGAFGKNNSDQEEALTVILNSTDQLITLVNNLLDESKYSAGKMRLDLSDCDLVGLSRDVISEFKARIKSAGGVISLHSDSEELLLMLDKGKITQTIRNLVDNAIKYKSDKRPIHVKVTLKKLKRMVVVSVKDNGLGIPKDNVPKVFDKFFQVDQSMRKSVVGSGLGLAIIKKIVTLHGGKISAESELGVGSTFRFTIPLKKSKSN